ncbi:TPA: hypothetical protein HA231_03925 [Candidatus Woesearchaeota archaeon]|nr:hypothetical protein [Candidatus Woesearchaeota archaeon]
MTDITAIVKKDIVDYVVKPAARVAGSAATYASRTAGRVGSAMYTAGSSIARAAGTVRTACRRERTINDSLEAAMAGSEMKHAASQTAGFGLQLGMGFARGALFPLALISSIRMIRSHYDDGDTQLFGTIFGMTAGLGGALTAITNGKGKEYLIAFGVTNIADYLLNAYRRTRG